MGGLRFHTCANLSGEPDTFDRESVPKPPKPPKPLRICGPQSRGNTGVMLNKRGSDQADRIVGARTAWQFRQHVLGQPGLAPRKILVLKNNRKERQPGDFNVCDRTVPPAGAPLALWAAMAGVVRPPRLAPSMLQPCSRRREKTWHEMIRAVLRGGPLSGEPPKFKAAANMRSSR